MGHGVMDRMRSFQGIVIALRTFARILCFSSLAPSRVFSISAAVSRSTSSKSKKAFIGLSRSCDMDLSIMPCADKDKQRKFQRDHLQRKKQQNSQWHAELKKRQKQRRDRIHDIVNHIKRSTGCLLCDETDPKTLQFHHVLPHLKKYTVAQLISNRSKLPRILDEIDRCVCVCITNV